MVGKSDNLAFFYARDRLGSASCVSQYGEQWSLTFCKVAEARVQSWRDAEKLLFPEFSKEHRPQIENTLDYPQTGSSGAENHGERDGEIELNFMLAIMKGSLFLVKIFHTIKYHG